MNQLSDDLPMDGGAARLFQELVTVEVFRAINTVSELRKGKAPAKDYAPVQAVSDDVIEATLRHIVYAPIRDMIKFQRLVGRRPGELFIMRPLDIDRTGGGHADTGTPAAARLTRNSNQGYCFLFSLSQSII